MDQELSHAVSEGLYFRTIRSIVQERSRQRHLPFKNHLRGNAIAAKFVSPDASDIAEKRAPSTLPLHFWCVIQRDGFSCSFCREEWILNEQHQPLSLRKPQERAKFVSGMFVAPVFLAGSKLGQVGSGCECGHDSLLHCRTQWLDSVHQVIRAWRSGNPYLLRHKMPCCPYFINDIERVTVRFVDVRDLTGATHYFRH